MSKNYPQMYAAVRAEIAKVVIENNQLAEMFCRCLVTDGHLWIEGVPGLAKTKFAIAASMAIEGMVAEHHQMTADLSPSQLLGSEVWNPHTLSFESHFGPLVEANIWLLDELRRCPPKTQASLLRAMQERQVKVGKVTRTLKTPCIVIATDNPGDNIGVFEMPEAIRDRFSGWVILGYISPEGELQMVRDMDIHARDWTSMISSVMHIDDVLASRIEYNAMLRAVPESVRNYAVQLCRATRPSLPEFQLMKTNAVAFFRKRGNAFESLDQYIKLGAAPRGPIETLRQATAHAYLAGKTVVTIDDVKAVAYSTLGHRIILTSMAKLDGFTTRDLLDLLLDPSYGVKTPPQ